MQKRTFVKLQKLVDVTYEGETQAARERWLRNCVISGVADGYTYMIDDESTFESADFACDELEFTDEVCMYDFMGDAIQEERFYVRDEVIFKHRQTGSYYILYSDDLCSF